MKSLVFLYAYNNRFCFIMFTVFLPFPSTNYNILETYPGKFVKRVGQDQQYTCLCLRTFMRIGQLTSTRKY